MGNEMRGRTLDFLDERCYRKGGWKSHKKVDVIHITADGDNFTVQPTAFLHDRSVEARLDFWRDKR